MNMNTFPLSFQQHMIFCAIAVVFLVLQFIRQRYWYQPVVAAAVAASLLIYVNESEKWFHTVGAAELVMMLAAVVLYIVQARKLAKAEKAKEEAQKAAAEAEKTDAPVAEASAHEEEPAAEVALQDAAEAEEAAEEETT